ncbi:MAG: Brp/Blh family beta-carotene 15,15'-dioxygenase [bacterium]
MTAIGGSKIFSRITWINAAVGLGMLAYHYTISPLPMNFQLFYFLLMTAATGIPHGALDHIIAKTNTEKHKQEFSIQHFLGKYVLVILFYTACWIIFPSISLLIFLIISAWHFGEIDLSEASDHVSWNISRLLWGSFVLLTILLTHQQDTEMVIMRITKSSPQVTAIWEAVKQHGLIIVAITGLITLASIIIANKNKKLTISLPIFLNLVIILSLCALLPLLPAFALYFGGWHAIRSFELIFRFLQKEKQSEAERPITMWKHSLPMTFLATIGFIFLAYIWNAAGLKTDPLPALFIFLSIITLPHLDVMDQLIKKNNASLPSTEMPR